MNLKKIIVISCTFGLLVGMTIYNSSLSEESDSDNYKKTNSIGDIFPKLASNSSNRDTIQYILDNAVSEYASLGYYPSLYRPSITGTFYTVYILEAIGRLGMINQTEVIDYIMAHYNTTTKIFSDDYSKRFMEIESADSKFRYTSELITNCQAVWTIQLLGGLSLIDTQAMITYLWNCYNSAKGSFMGRENVAGVQEFFKEPSLENTYWAVLTLEFLDPSWTNHGFDKNSLINYLDTLQVLDASGLPGPNGWTFGGFLDNLNTSISTSEFWYVTMMTSYNAITALNILSGLGPINQTEFNTWLNEVYDNVEYKFHNNVPTIVLGYSPLDIPSSAIGVELSGQLGFSISRSNVLDYVIKGLNPKGYWYNSGNNRNYHELISSFEVIRSLKGAGELSILNSSVRDNLANGIINDFSSYNGGYAFVGKDHATLDQINALINSFYQYGRIGDLNITFLYNKIAELGDGALFDGDFIRMVSINNQENNEFRLIPIESYPQEALRIENQHLTNSPNTLFMAMNSLKKIFKLDDFDIAYDINKAKDEIIASQFLDPLYPNLYGSFYSSSVFQGNLERSDYVLFQNCYWAIRSLEEYISYKGTGDLHNIGIDTLALYYQIINRTIIYRRMVKSRNVSRLSYTTV